MRNQSSHLQLFVFLFLLAFARHSSLTSAQEIENEEEFDYIEGSGRGPEHWGELHEEWSLCKNGTMQSPIDLLYERVEVVPSLGRLKRLYRPSNATIKNRGHDIMLEWVNGGGSLYINGTEFVLRQCHWHTPSEHVIDGQRFDLEIHMVHQRSGTQLPNVAVVGKLYKFGKPDPFLSKLEMSISSIVDKKEKVVGMVDPRHIGVPSKNYYRYMGSLTTPPCTENVVWTVTKEVGTVSRKQVKLLRKAVDDNAENNARPLQAINGRMIQFYGPKIEMMNREEESEASMSLLS
ncbi:alpha carbonic anhydrase 7-like [Aristolochia californica]|uniref:alpha carbonic anhydrase 7-like n=1 Tax=Aristolochia californica TaxID=171875 RepID=UPI0035DDAA70